MAPTRPALPWRDLDAVVRASEAAVRVAPGDAEARLALAQAIADARRPGYRTAALAAARHAAVLAPNDPRPHVLMGQLEELASKQRARQAYLQAVERSRWDRTALAALAHLRGDTVDRVAWARCLEADRPHPRRPGEESLLSQLAMRRVAAVGGIGLAPAAVPLALVLAAFIPWWLAGLVAIATVVAVTSAATWALAPAITARWVQGTSTWWLFDAHILRRQRRSGPAQLLGTFVALVWLLVVAATTFLLIAPSSEPDPLARPVPVTLDGPIVLPDGSTVPVTDIVREQYEALAEHYNENVAPRADTGSGTDWALVLVRPGFVIVVLVATGVAKLAKRR